MIEKPKEATAATGKKATKEDEYKAKMVEQRRLARERAEHEVEEEKKKLEEKRFDFSHVNHIKLLLINEASTYLKLW